MNGNTLRYFVVVADERSMRAAAKTLNISQSALSRQIIGLEQELDSPLFERLPRGIALTSAGEIFLRYARQSLAQADVVKSDIGALQGLHRGAVRVAAPELFMHFLLPECLKELRRTYPGVDAEVRLHATNGIVDDVREGRVDFGIAYNPDLDSELQSTYSIREKIVGVMRPDHPLANRTTLALSDLIGVPLALPLPDSATGVMIQKEARRRGIKLRAALQSSSVHMRLTMALQSDLLAIVAYVSASDLIAARELVAIPMREKQFDQGGIALFSLRGRRLSIAANTLQKMVHRRLQSVEYRSRFSGEAV